MKNNKRYQTLLISVHIFQTICSLLLNIFAVRANSKFHFFRAAVSKIRCQTVTSKIINTRECVSVNCFVNFYTSLQQLEIP